MRLEVSANWFPRTRRWPKRAGWRVGILTRGYGRAIGSTGVVDVDGVEAPAAYYGDEPVLLARRLPGVPVLVGSDRTANAHDALRHHAVDLLILDDGFQHWAVARDVDIVVLDGSRPFGNGHLLPLGTLRESVSALRRAQLILVRQTPTATNAPEALRQQLHRRGVTAPVIPMRYRPTAIDEPLTGQSREVASLSGRRVRLLSSIAQPRSFESQVQALGAQVAARYCYPDHYVYTADDLRQWGGDGRMEPIVTTEKDWMRLEPLARATPLTAPLLVLRIVVELVNRDDETLIDDRLAGLRRR